MKPVITKKTYYTVTFMRDDGAVRAFRMRGGSMRFLILFLCVLLPGAGAAGVAVGLHYRYKTWVLADEVRSTERQLTDARIRLEQLSSVETIATTLGTSPLGTSVLGVPSPTTIPLNNELFTRNATSAPKAVAQAPSSDILTLLQSSESPDATSQNATRSEAPADGAMAESVGTLPERNATLAPTATAASTPATPPSATPPPAEQPAATPQRNATPTASSRSETRTETRNATAGGASTAAPYEDTAPAVSTAAAPPAAPETPTTTVTAAAADPKLPQITDDKSPVRISNFQIQASNRRLRLRFDLVSQDQQRVSGQIHYQLELRNGSRQDLESVEGARYFSIAWKRQMEGAARLPQGVEVSDIQALGVRVTMEDGSSYHAKYLLSSE